MTDLIVILTGLVQLGVGIIAIALPFVAVHRLGRIADALEKGGTK